MSSGGYSTAAGVGRNLASQIQPPINKLQSLAGLAGLIIFMATTAVTFLVRAVTWTHVDVGQATGLAVSSAAVVVFILVCLVPDVGRDR